MFGDICLSLIRNTEKSWDDADADCKALNESASLATIKDYRVQAQIVAMMRSAKGDDIYVGLKATPSNPFFFWPDLSNPAFERWGTGQPDGYPLLTNEDYCVVLDNSNERQPGFWYDVPCTEPHKYICSMDLDVNSDGSGVPPALRCPYGFYALGDSACFGFNDTLSTYTEAEAACQALAQNPGEEIHLAMILDGYESALIETMMYSLGLDSGWIGLKSTDREFSWETGYPIVYTNWGLNEPSSENKDACVHAQTDGKNWDDTMCDDRAAYFCRFDRFGLSYPTPDPDLEKLPCPTGWVGFEENCYYFSSIKRDWGESNYRCMQSYEGSFLTSITSASESQFVLSQAQSQYPMDSSIWIGLVRSQTGNNDWSTFGWLDGSEFNYAFWSRGEPDGYPTDLLLESCGTMHITTAGAGAWSDEICQFSALYSVCKMPKQQNYTERICGDFFNSDEIQIGDYCYLPSTVTGFTTSTGTWREAENACRAKGGNLVSIHNPEEQALVRILSYGFARSYWIGLRKFGNSNFGWSDLTDFDINDYSEFPNDQLPDNLADEEECAELLIWQNGEWGTSACGNSLNFVCKRKETEGSPKPLLPDYPTTGDCPDNYFKLGNMCYSVKGTTASERKGWIAARDDCRSGKAARGWTLATVSHPGQQALMTAIIKAFEGVDMWIGLNGIGIHNQYHWSDESPLEYTAWMEGQPDNVLPITDPNSQSCVVMMNNPYDPGRWNDVTCSVPRAYLCQSPLVTPGGTPPDLPGNKCSDNRYTQYFATCFLMENTYPRTFDDARADCQSKGGNLLSLSDQYEMALLVSALYGTYPNSPLEAWIGLQSTTQTGTYEWIDDFPLEFTKWGPNEPNNNNGRCVVLTPDGYMAVRACSDTRNYFCEYPSTPPEKPQPQRGTCPGDYVELPGTDSCILFKTQNLIVHDDGDYICTTQHDGGRLPSIHSIAEDNFIAEEAKKVFLGTNVYVWLGMRRSNEGFNTWIDRSLMDFVNWKTQEPTDDRFPDNNCVRMDVNGGWEDVGCSQRSNYICQLPKKPALPTPPPTRDVIKSECPDNFYRFGDTCLTLISSDEKPWTDANDACESLNSKASLAIIKDYRTHAQIVALMRGYAGQDVYIGLKATPSFPLYVWPDDTTPTFTRWGVGQPDGYPLLTNRDYCVVMDNSNTKQPGYWYDVPCSERHRYICSMDPDPIYDGTQVPPARRCRDDFYAVGDSACFAIFTSLPSTFDEAEAACSAMSPPPGQGPQINLAMVLDGYESAVLDTMLYALGQNYAWIGMKATDREYGWVTGYPVVYTNWGLNEPSGQDNEGCVRTRIDGDNWDDTTCSDTAAYFCRYDQIGMPFPTPDPDTGNPCPSGWESFESNCYYFSDIVTDWGEANFRCLRMYEGATLASITSAAENEFVYSRANNRYPGGDFVWIGLTRVQTGNNDWRSFGWIDGSEFNYAFWSRGEPDGYPADLLVETCVTMSITTAGAGAWSDEICQFKALYSVCKMPKQQTYTSRECSGQDIEIKIGSDCYLPSTVTGMATADATWREAENICRDKGGNLVSIHSSEEQSLVRILSFGFARSYWIGLRKYGNGDFGWSDGTTFDINQYSEFPGDQLPVNLADEEECAELLIWQNGEWGTSACGNKLKYVCKRKESGSSPKDPLPDYPTGGGCPDDYFKLGKMCYSVKGASDGEGKGWIAARDDCRSGRTERGWTLATVSHPGQQALMTAIIKAFSGVDMWIGLNGIGIHNQYHWSDESPLEYTAWMEGQPDNIIPITDPNSQSCVVMMNNPDDPGSWNDVTCSVPRAYLCQSPLVTPGGTPPDPPGNQCADSRYTPYFDTCYLMDSSSQRSFGDARTNCQSRGGDLLSLFDQYEAAMLTSLLYQDDFDESAEAWIGMRRNTATGVFEWIDNYPLQFTKWGPNEPNNNNGDCVVLTRAGYWAVRGCDTIKYYYCEYPTQIPEKPGLRGGVCSGDYVELPGTDYCVVFDTPSQIQYDSGDYTCSTKHNGGVLPSVHSQAENDFILAEAKKVFGEINTKIWLGMRRDSTRFNSWSDLSLMDYANWQANEPSDDENENNKCVQMDLMSGEWADVNCNLGANYICRVRKQPGPPTRSPTQPPPTKPNSATQPVSGLLSILLSAAALLFARC
ncbi:macrophage mannose receptor 1-like isoform X2 [Acanthaster planci]|nr:macrophage mannose receptor 1-like isoform X2 [Acanthaster planci]